jgi:hypothetical protein
LGCGVPFGFGYGELFADFDGCVVDGESDYVYGEFFGCELETFLLN